MSQYLAAMADTMGGEGSPSVADSLTGDETLEEILRTAVGLEKDSILFYLRITSYNVCYTKLLREPGFQRRSAEFMIHP